MTFRLCCGLRYATPKGSLAKDAISVNVNNVCLTSIFNDENIPQSLWKFDWLCVFP